MDWMAKQFPEYNIGIDIYGVGLALAPQLIAEIGDVYRFKSKKSLIGFAELMRLCINQALSLFHHAAFQNEVPVI